VTVEPRSEGAELTEAPWQRLDPRVLAVFPLRQAGALIPVVVVLLISGQGQGGWQLLAALAPVLVVLGIGVTRWATVRYRVGEERVELRGGLIHREQRSLRRDRVRTVDLRANPAHRIFGLTVVEIGTGSSSTKEGRLSLDAVPVAGCGRGCFPDPPRPPPLAAPRQCRPPRRAQRLGPANRASIPPSASGPSRWPGCTPPGCATRRSLAPGWSPSGPSSAPRSGWPATPAWT
jgi:membrane protein YdbS with pleckstrin-like domain